MSVIFAFVFLGDFLSACDIKLVLMHEVVAQRFPLVA